MKILITYRTLLKFNELYFPVKTPHKLSFLNKNKKNNNKENKTIHKRGRARLSTTLTKVVSFHNMNQDYLLSN